jgi:hypothetical protein
MWSALHIASAAIPAVIVVAAMFNLAQALAALRAKERLRARLNDLIERDERVQTFRQQALTKDLGLRELADMHAILDNLASEMSEHDRKAVQRILSQPSRAGERRFIQNMLTAA